jgi:hypothetical protein
MRANGVAWAHGATRIADNTHIRLDSVGHFVLSFLFKMSARVGKSSYPMQMVGPD